MQVTVKSLPESELDRLDCRDVFTISIDGERVFIVTDGEPEYSDLSREFSNCWGIVDLMRLAHIAGLNAEPFSVKEEIVLSEDI